MKVFFVLFMTDFFLTYMGIKANIITEGNPLLIWMFEVPFLAGLLLRLLMFTCIGVIPAFLMNKYSHKLRPVFRKAYFISAIGVNTFILGTHLYWIISYMMWAL